MIRGSDGRVRGEVGISDARVAVAGSCPPEVEKEALRLGRGMGVAATGFVADGADFCEVDSATETSSATAACSSAGEADGGGVDSVTSLSWETCAAWVRFSETALALLERPAGAGAGAARRAGALGANFLPDLSTAKYCQLTVQLRPHHSIWKTD